MADTPMTIAELIVKLQADNPDGDRAWCHKYPWEWTAAEQVAAFNVHAWASFALIDGENVPRDPSERVQRYCEGQSIQEIDALLKYSCPRGRYRAGEAPEEIDKTSLD